MINYLLHIIIGFDLLIVLTGLVTIYVRVYSNY